MKKFKTLSLIFVLLIAAVAAFAVPKEFTRDVQDVKQKIEKAIPQAIDVFAANYETNAIVAIDALRQIDRMGAPDHSKFTKLFASANTEFNRDYADKLAALREEFNWRQRLIDSNYSVNKSHFTHRFYLARLHSARS